MNYKVLLVIPVVALTTVISEYKSASQTVATKASTAPQVATPAPETPIATPTPSVVPTPEPIPTTAPVVQQVQHAVGVEQWRSLVSKYFPSYDVNRVLAIMNCESGGNPYSHNSNAATGDNSYGLMQINIYGSLASSRPSGDWLMIPENNISYAAKMYDSQGLAPWSCSRKI